MSRLRPLFSSTNRLLTLLLSLDLQSDPYAVFTLNDEKVFKSETKKKTLAPVWNEKFEVDVLSRVGADFEVEVFDWNQREWSFIDHLSFLPLTVLIRLILLLQSRLRRA